ncbi:hypothetical protein LCGC14_3007550, partial [marine sediment metagenome]
VSYNDYLEERYPEKGGSKKPVTVEVTVPTMRKEPRPP